MKSNTRWYWSCLFFTAYCIAISGLLAAQSSQGAQKPQLVANSNRYRVSGLKPATGRSGSAAIAVRGLQSADGQTLIEVTTGELDSRAVPPGKIEKVQFKPLDTYGEAMFAQNFTGLTGGGYYSFLTNVLHRGQQAQVQANVSGIDPKRTNVVTVVETVKLRPDLAVEFAPPARGPVNTPIVLGATILESNRDIGATADCALYVDSVEVDRAVGIWVDAAGVVTCAFSHVFRSTGAKALEVKVLNVVPGDFDTANNSASGVIDIVEPTTPLNYYAAAGDYDFHHSQQWDYKRYYNGALYYHGVGEEHQQGWYQYAYLDAWSSHRLKFPINAKRIDSSDGNVVVVAEFLNVLPLWSGSWNDTYSQGSCDQVWLFDNGVSSYVSSCDRRVHSTGDVYNWLWHGSYRWASDVTYQSRGHYCEYWRTGDPNTCEPADYYSWNGSGVNRQGVRLPYGSDYLIQLSLTGSDGNVFGATPAISLVPFDHAGNRPFTCFDWTSPPYTARDCHGWDYRYTGKTGSVYDNSHP